MFFPPTFLLYCYALDYVVVFSEMEGGGSREEKGYVMCKDICAVRVCWKNMSFLLPRHENLCFCCSSFDIVLLFRPFFWLWLILLVLHSCFCCCCKDIFVAFMSYRFINLYELLSIVWAELINEASLLKLVSPSPPFFVIPEFSVGGVLEFISFRLRLRRHLS